MANKPIILVDGSSYLFRAYHALPPLTNKDGHPTGAMYGVINMLRKLMQETHPEKMAVVFDTKGKNHRHALYPEYKANRPEMPEELSVQIAPLHDIIRAMGLPLIAVSGVEADDVIGTLAIQAVAAGERVVVSTGDKDFAQIVGPDITLVNTMTDTLMDASGVVQKFGVPAEQIIDYLALVGDTVDNVPGVSKVGPKTAVKWLEAYGSLEGIIDNAHHIKGKIGENLRAAIPDLPLYQTLVTIQCDVDLPVTLDDLTLASPDIAQLENFFRTYEFKSWLKELDSLGAAQAQTQTAQSYDTISTVSVLKDLVKKIKKAKCMAFDLETTSLDTLCAEIVGVAIGVEQEAVYIPCGHKETATQLTQEVVFEHLSPLLRDSQIKKLGHNLKYDLSVLQQQGYDLKGIACDSMLASYVLNSTATRHDMDSVAQFYLNRKTIHYEDVVGKGAKQINFADVSVAAATQYAAEDADVTAQLCHCLVGRLKETPALMRVLEEIEMPLMPVLATMEQTGVLIDSDALAKQSTQLAASCEALETEAYTLAGESFNINSPKQLQQILYDKLALPILQKTPTGQPSTAEPVLHELAQSYELPSIILSFRSLSKLKSTYTDKLPQQVHAKTGRVHTSYHQAVTATGRLSSSEPNLQNIPIRTAEGRRIRKAFIAPKGYQLLAADYSQIELRIMAHLSQDKRLIQAFHDGADIHRATAAEIFGVGAEQVEADQRRAAKAINFGLMYGMSAWGLAKQLEVDRGTAEAYIKHYFERYPGVKTYMDATREKAAQQGFVETLMGRRLYLPDIKARHMGRRRAAERAAINAPMQGTAADIIKKAMISVHDWATKQAQQVRLIMQVHDELILEVPTDQLDAARTAVAQLMAEAMTLDVPLIADTGVGADWEAAH